MEVKESTVWPGTGSTGMAQGTGRVVAILTLLDVTVVLLCMYASMVDASYSRLAEHTILDLNIRIIFVCIRIYAYVRMFGHPQIEISLLRAPN